MRAGSARAVLAAVVVALLVLGVIASLPAIRPRASAALVLVEAVGVDAPRPFAADVEPGEIALPGGRPADLYDAGPGAPGLVLLPGAAPAGRDDHRVERLAASLARADVTVLVPELELYQHRFVEADVETVVDAVRLLHEREPLDDVTVLGISFGGSLALVAAADPRIREVVGTVATFGAYADLVGLLQAAATGTSVVHGARFPWDPPAQAEQALRSLALELTPADQRPALAQVLASGTGAASLQPEARAAYELVTAEDPADVDGLVERLAPEAGDRLQHFSPITVADQLRADVLALHSRDDPAVPYAELLRLGLAFPSARTYTVESFEHVDLAPGDDVAALVRDLLVAWWFAADVLAATGT